MDQLPHKPNFNIIYNITKQVDLLGRKLRVVGLADPDYAYQLTLKNGSDGGIEFNSGFTLDLLLLLQFCLHFSYIAIKGTGWSDLLPNGSWAGVGSQILSTDPNISAEFSIAQSTLLPWNVKVFDFLFPTSKGFLVAAFRQPPSNSVRNILTASFPPELWIVLIIFAFVFTLSIKLLQFCRDLSINNRRINLPCAKNNVVKIANKMDEMIRKQDFDEMDASLAKDSGYWVLVTFCQRGTDGSPESIPMRIIYLALAILSIISYVVFSAALVSNLSVILLPIKTFSDLVQSQLRIYGDASIPFTHGYVENIVNERLQQGGKPTLSSLDPSYYLKVHNGIRKIIDGSGTYITFEDALNTAYTSEEFHLSDDYVCKNLFKLTVPGVKMNGGMMVKKGSGLRDILNPKVATLFERGFVKRFHTIRYGSLFPRCLSDGVVATPALNLQDVYTAFVILLLGFVLCTGVFCGELAFLYGIRLFLDRNDSRNSPQHSCCWTRIKQKHQSTK